MRAIIVVSLLAIGIAFAIGETSETAKSLREIEDRTARMMRNPSPNYEHYPKPENQDAAGETGDTDKNLLLTEPQ